MVHLRIRPATWKDDLRLFKLRNEPFIYKNGFSGAPVPWAHHEIWFAKAIKESLIFIIENKESGVVKAVGSIRFDPDEERGFVFTSIYMLERFCGSGYGPKLLRAACPIAQKKWPDKKIVAEFLPENKYSRTAFRRAGFVKFGERRMQWMSIK